MICCVVVVEEQERNMDAQKVIQAGLRGKIEEMLTSVQEEVQKPERNKNAIMVWERTVSSFQEQLKEVNTKILDFLAKEKESQSQILDELKEQRKLEEKIQEIRILCEKKTAPDDDAKAVDDEDCEMFKAPKKAIHKFNGDLTSWISWFSSFEVIHKSKKMPNKLKFDHLIDWLEPGSRAMEVVKGFQRTGANYVKAMAALEKVFGNKDDLVNALTTRIWDLLASKDKIPFVDLYWQLSTKIQELESQGVMPRDPVASPLLFGTVYNCLREDRKLNWKRYYEFLSDARKTASKLELLMEWLEAEVIHDNSEETINM